MALGFSVSCSDTAGIEARLDELDERMAGIEDVVRRLNDNVTAVSRLCRKGVVIVGFESSDTGYELRLGDGTSVNVTYGINASGIVPVIGVDGEGNWIMSLDDGVTFTVIEGADNVFSGTGHIPLIEVDEDGFWVVSVDGGKTFGYLTGNDGKPLSAVEGPVSENTFFEDVSYDRESGWFTMTLMTGENLRIPLIDTFYIDVIGYAGTANIFLGQTLTYKVESSDVEQAVFQVPEGWQALLTDTELVVVAPASGVEDDYCISLLLSSSDGYLLHEKYVFHLIEDVYDASYCKEFNDYLAKNEDNVLPDFSFAGYMYGEVAPPEASATGYAVYDVTDYGAVPDDGKSDRDAFLKCVEAATGSRFVENTKNLTLEHKTKSNAIVYFPEGEYILHTKDDDYTENGVTYSRTIQIRTGNFILRGAGRDKTTLIMQAPALPTDESVLYSSPLMIDFKHNSGLSEMGINITENAAKGAFSVKVSSTSGLSVGTWICLSVQNNDPDYVAEELKAGAPQPAEFSDAHDIVKNGVKVYEYHCIKSIDGNVVTFHEPIHHAVEIQYTGFTGGYNWSILKYPHYENVGIEDLTFKGNAKASFSHHASWEDDGAYKPLGMTRLVNSWLRRVRFSSVSEGCSVTNCSNVSVYDVEFDGNRGHSSIRSQVSARVFIGAVVDRADGYLIDDPGTFVKGAGQYHAVGVSKPSIGTVLWRNRWGSDSCFESHATQPRATLIDHCTGGWMKYRQGGDANQVPNHLDDLIIWNFCSVTPQSGTFNWWDHDSQWWKFLPPVVIGFHGESAAFDETQMKLNSSNGMPVNPESLYEAQLKERLGFLPVWLEDLK